jgi:hypothetical protein
MRSSARQAAATWSSSIVVGDAADDEADETSHAAEAIAEIRAPQWNALSPQFGGVRKLE